MASGNVSRVRFGGPGRLVLNPTDLAAAFPHGGVEIGHAKSIAVSPLGEPFLIRAEGLGGDITDVLHGDRRHAMSCFLRGWDDDAVRLLHADAYEEGAVTRHAVYRIPGESVPGESMMPDHEVQVLYVPDDLVGTDAFFIHRGIPDWSPGVQVLWQTREELGMPILIHCLEDDEGNVLQIGRFHDLVLA